MIFKHLHEQESIDENTVLSVEKALVEAFSELEHWEREMLTHSMCPEVFEVIIK